MLNLRTEVTAIVIDGQTANEIQGQIRGRTLEQNPRYDVIDLAGKVHANLPADAIKVRIN